MATSFMPPLSVAIAASEVFERIQKDEPGARAELVGIIRKQVPWGDHEVFGVLELWAQADSAEGARAALDQAAAMLTKLLIDKLVGIGLGSPREMFSRLAQDEPRRIAMIQLLGMGGGSLYDSASQIEFVAHAATLFGLSQAMVQPILQSLGQGSPVVPPAAVAQPAIQLAPGTLPPPSRPAGLVLPPRGVDYGSLSWTFLYEDHPFQLWLDTTGKFPGMVHVCDLLLAHDGTNRDVVLTGAVFDFETGVLTLGDATTKGAWSIAMMPTVEEAARALWRQYSGA